MDKDHLRILAFGAHPDDCDVKLSGIAVQYARQGHRVKFVSVTNGDAGHHEIGGVELTKRRYEEAQRVATIAGIEYQILDNHDGQLMPTLQNRFRIIQIIREFLPDLVITHRLCDYHPDHRYTSQLVQDAAYMVTVPNVEPLTPHLLRNPIIAYMSDTFQRPYPFSPEIVVGIDDVAQQKLAMLDCHESQMYEWLPYNSGVLDQVPSDPQQRREWLWQHRAPHDVAIADRYRDRLKELYGPERGAKIRHAEALEICEYGAPLAPADIPTLFPFFSR